jgi:hypothetical protein
MLGSIIEFLDKELPCSTNHISEQKWNSIRFEAGKLLFSFVVKLLIEIELSGFQERLAMESKIDKISDTEPLGLISGIRIRPNDSYYRESLTIDLPRINGELFYGSVGIEVSFEFYPCPTWFFLRFCVWGEYERSNFGEMLRDHRYFIKKLITNLPIDLITACAFDNLPPSCSLSTDQKLELYYENETDDENYFCLKAQFDENSSEEIIVSVLTSFALLYDAVMGYIISQKDCERIYQ